MKRIVVLDSGWGGEMVADLIEAELAIVEVVRVIDWRHAPYSRRRRSEMLSLAEAALAPYWGRTDVVVLGGYEVSLIAPMLQAKHPQQKFVTLELDRFLARRHQPKRRVLLLSDPRLLRMAECDALVSALHARGIEVYSPQCAHWTELIDAGEMTPEIIKETLLAESSQNDPEKQAAFAFDTVMLANTHYWDIVDQLREVLRWPVHVVDMRDDLLTDVCRALGLRGGSGKRVK